MNRTEATEKPPTDAQVAKFYDYATRISIATSEQDLDNVSVLVKDARGAEKITRALYHRLSYLAAVKRGELRGITQ